MRGLNAEGLCLQHIDLTQPSHSDTIYRVALVYLGGVLCTQTLATVRSLNIYNTKISYQPSQYFTIEDVMNGRTGCWCMDPPTT